MKGMKYLQGGDDQAGIQLPCVLYDVGFLDRLISISTRLELRIDNFILIGSIRLDRFVRRFLCTQRRDCNFDLIYDDTRLAGDITRNLDMMSIIRSSFLLLACSFC